MYFLKVAQPLPTSDKEQPQGAPANKSRAQSVIYQVHHRISRRLPRPQAGKAQEPWGCTPVPAARTCQHSGDRASSGWHWAHLWRTGLHGFTEQRPVQLKRLPTGNSPAPGTASGPVRPPAKELARRTAQPPPRLVPHAGHKLALKNHKGFRGLPTAQARPRGKGEKGGPRVAASHPANSP